MNVTERKDCRACGGVLETVHDFGEVPVINFSDARPDLKAPLELTLCKSCSLLQLRHTVSPELLFRTYFYRSSQNSTMKAHLRGVVEEVQKRVALKESDLVVDIGSNDGTLLSFYPQSLLKVGFEPSQVEQVNVGSAYAMRGYFFSAEGMPTFPDNASRQAKAITAIAMFYDLDDPNAFLADVKKVLAPDGLFVVEQNYLPEMLRTNNIGNLVAEHLVYYSATTMLHLLRDNGFVIDDIEFSDINGGVFRVYASHKTAEKDYFGRGKALGDALMAEDKMGLDKMQTYTDFVARVFDQAAKLHEFIESEGKSEVMTSPPTIRFEGTTGIIHAANVRQKVIDIYGPSTRGLMLLQVAGLTAKHFRWAVDRDPSKVGKTYMGVPVVSEAEMRQNPPDYALILPQGFLEEFLKREEAFLLGGGAFIVPLPEPFLVRYERL